MDLVKKHCVPCEGGVKPFSRKKAAEYLKITPKWKLEGGIKIAREFKFKDFDEAMRFINKVAEIAKEEDHHPDMLLYSWNRVKLTVYTHAIGGLSENDFIIAAKVNNLK